MDQPITNGLTITLPSRGETDWDENIKTYCFIPISAHKHEGNGSGNKLRNEALYNTLEHGVGNEAVDTNVIRDLAITRAKLAAALEADLATLETDSQGLKDFVGYIASPTYDPSVSGTLLSRLLVIEPLAINGIASLGSMLASDGTWAGFGTSYYMEGNNDLTNNLLDLDTQVRTNKDDIDTCLTDVATLQSDVTSLQNRSLSSLSDVSSAFPANGQALAWNDASNSWQPQTISGGSGGGVAENSFVGIITEWQEYTPTFNGATYFDNINFKYRRVGDSIEIRGNFQYNGTPSGINAKFSLPTGLSIDTNKIGPSRQTQLGTAVRLDTIGAFADPPLLSLYYNNLNGDNSHIWLARGDQSGSQFEQYGWDAFGADNDVITVEGSAPILGWDAVGLIDQSGSVDVVCTTNGLTSEPSISAGPGHLITQWNTPSIDTTNSFSNGVFTVPETGYYDINFGLYIFDDSASSMTLVKALIFVDNTEYRSGSVQTQGTTANTINVSALGAYLTKGQQVSFKALHGGGELVNKIKLLADLTYFDISKRNSSQAIISGVGSDINYISNAKAVVNLAGWNEYDGTTAIPSGVITGTASLTFERNEANPLRGSADFKLTTTSASLGEGVAYDFSVQRADLSKKMLIEFEYDASHSGYDDGDVKVFVYDVTNSKIIRVNGEDLRGGKGRHYAQFQTSANGSDYRLLFHVTSANVYSIYLDDIKVSPVGVNDSVSSQDVFANYVGVVPTNNDNIYPSGSSKVVKYKIAIEDTTASYDSSTGIYTVPETGIYTINASVLMDFNGGWTSTATHPDEYFLLSLYVDGVQKFVEDRDSEIAGSTNRYIQPTLTQILRLNKGQEVEIRALQNSGVDQTIADSGTYAILSILKSPSLSLPESVGSGRDIYVVGRGSGGSYTITAETERIPFTILEDSTGSMSTTDNGPDTFTVPETGSYTIEGNVACSLDNVFTTQTIVAYVNGNLFRSIQTSDNATDRYKHFSAILRLNKGDVLDFRFSPGSAIQLDNISTYHWIHIEKLSSAQVVLDSGSDIVARYSLTSTLTVNDLTPTTVPFNLKHFDTTNSFSNGIYTVPETGYYDVNAIVALNDSSQVINKGCQLAIHVDNVEVIRKNYEANSTNTADADSYTVSDLLFLEKDQELKIVMSHNNGVSITLTTVASRNVFSIAKRK